MAVSGTRERRPAVWPWLVMPIVVLLVFCALLKVHKQGSGAPAAAAPPPAQTATPKP
jgi:hypothetical protein